MPPKRGERGRGARGAHTQAPPPAARPPGGARFAPSASYIAAHSTAPPPPPVQPAVYHGGAAPSAHPDTLDHLLAGLQPVVPQPPPALLDRSTPHPPPAGYASYAGPGPGPAVYSGRGAAHSYAPVAAAPPVKAAWPPPQPAYDRRAYSRTPSVPPVDLAPPRRTHPPAPVYPAPPVPHPPTHPIPASPSYSSAPTSRPPSVPPAGSFQHLSAPAIPPTVPAPAVPAPPTLPTASPAVLPKSPPSASPAASASTVSAASPAVLQADVPPPPATDEKPQPVTGAAGDTHSSSDPASSDDSSSSSSSSSDSDDSDSGDDARVAGALVGERQRSRPVEDDEAKEATAVDGEKAAKNETSDSDLDSDSSSESDSEKEDAHLDGDGENAVSDLEEAVQEQVDEEDDHGQDETLPFDLGSADEADDHDEDVDVDEGVDDSLEHVAANARRKRRRLDSVGLASTVGGDDAMSDVSRVTSRAVSVDPAHAHDLLLSPTRRASVPPQGSEPAHPAATPFRFPIDMSGSTSTPARPVPARDSAAPPSPSADPSLLILPQKRPLDDDDDDEIEEGEVVSDDDAPYSAARLSYPPFPAFAGAAPAASRASFDRAASAPYDDAANASMDMDMSFADLPADLLADPSRRAAGAISIPISSRASSAAPSTASGQTSETGKASYAGKASYERKNAAAPPVDLSGGTPVAPKGGVPHPAAGKLSYKPSPLSKPADPSLASASAAPVKAVYVRRKDASTSSTPSASIAPASASSTAVAAAGQVKAVYERPAGATVTAAPARATKNKKNKARGVMPFTKDEKRERLPAKIFSAFGEFATLEAASHAAIFNVPHHTVLPAKNLPPPNESAQHGFWPGPPNRKDALKKAIFPAPPEPLEDVDDDRPRVEVFIDNSNVLYSFLNWVRARPEAKITSTKIGAQKGKDGKPQPAKTIKTVTIAGKKVKLDYKMLFALLERGRRVERRVLVGSSALWQSLEPAVEWGYEISLLQRVPRAEPSTSAAHTVAAAAQAAQQPEGGKKRKQGNKKAPAPPPVPQSQASQTKHYKEQAVDELVHLKILESLLDFEPPPMPPPSPTPAAAVIAPAAAAASEPADVPEGMTIDPPSAAAATPVAEMPQPADEAAPVAPPAVETGAPVSAERTTADVVSGAPETVASPAVPVEHAPDPPSTTVEADGVTAEAGSTTEQSSVRNEDDIPMSEAQAVASSSVAAGNADPSASSSAVPASATASPTIAPAIAPTPSSASVPATNAPAAAAAEPAVVNSRFVPSSAYLTGSAQQPAATTSQPKFIPAQPKITPAQPKITPAQPKITPAPPKIVPAAPKIVPAQPKPPAVVQFVPRRPARDRPVLVIVTGDANSSEYNPGGFLGCVRRALDRGWDVEIAAFTHGISSLWTGEQMKRTTSDGRRRGELRVIDLALFAEELVSV